MHRLKRQKRKSELDHKFVIYLAILRGSMFSFPIKSETVNKRMPVETIFCRDFLAPTRFQPDKAEKPRTLAG
jgi:hypothetical protein